jgi:hypothetical protein
MMKSSGKLQKKNQSRSQGNCRRKENWLRSTRSLRELSACDAIQVPRCHREELLVHGAGRPKRRVPSLVPDTCVRNFAAPLSGFRCPRFHSHGRQIALSPSSELRWNYIGEMKMINQRLLLVAEPDQSFGYEERASMAWILKIMQQDNDHAVLQLIMMARKGCPSHDGEQRRRGQLRRHDKKYLSLRSITWDRGDFASRRSVTCVVA